MSDTKRLLVMGATKGIGKAATEAALAEGHAVRALARGADRMEDRDGLERFAADALDHADMMRAVDGVDAVIFALGIKESPAMLWREVTLFSDATRILLDAMASAGVRRLVAVTGFGAGDSRSAMSALERVGHRAVLGKPYADKDRQEAMIRDSDTDWTIVRPTILTNRERSGRYKVLTDPRDWRNGLISRADVGEYCVAAAVGNRDVRKAVVLTR